MIETFLFARRHLPLDEVAKLVVDFITPAEITLDEVINAGAAELFMRMPMSLFDMESMYMERILEYDDTFLDVIAAKYDKARHPGAMEEYYNARFQEVYSNAILDADVSLVKLAVYLGIDPRHTRKDIEGLQLYVNRSEKTRAKHQPLLEFLTWCQGKPLDEIRYACSPALNPRVRI